MNLEGLRREAIWSKVMPSARLERMRAEARVLLGLDDALWILASEASLCSVPDFTRVYLS